MRESVLCPGIVENSRNSNRGRAGGALALLGKFLVEGVDAILHRSSDFLSMLIVVLVRYRHIQNDVRRLVQDRSAARYVGSGEFADCDENLGSISALANSSSLSGAELTGDSVSGARAAAISMTFIISLP